MKRSNATTERLFRAGNVLAVDRSEEMLASARERMKGNGSKNVRFVSADLNRAPDYLKDMGLGSLDAIAGRRVLMYLANPERVITDLLPWLREGGLVVFEEADFTTCPGQVAAMPAHERAFSWLDEMLSDEGVDRSMGFHLPATFIGAGLQMEHVSAAAVIEGQGDQYTLGELLQLVAPRLEAAGVATASTIESLAARIELEQDPSSVFVSGMRFCARARKP